MKEELLERHYALSLEAAIDRAYQEPPTEAEKKWLRLTRRKHKQLVEGEWGPAPRPSDRR
jgi:hypothetical protein